MIFTSLAFVALAFVLLLVGVIKGSLGFAVASLAVAVLAGLLLLMANAVYRQMAAAQEGDDSVDPAVRGGRMEAVSTTVPEGPAWTRTGPPVDGYADLNAVQAAKLVDTLSLDELHAMRRYEAEHANRKTVLVAVDDRIDTIVSVRRELTTTEI